MIRRLFVEKKVSFAVEARGLKHEFVENLGISTLRSVRLLARYDIEGLDDREFEFAKTQVFAEPQVDQIFEESLPCAADNHVFAVEFLPGQFDQRADSAAQCIQLITHKNRPLIQTARVFVLEGDLDLAALSKIKKYCINVVDSREASLDKPNTLTTKIPQPAPVETITGFIQWIPQELKQLHSRLQLAMTLADLQFCQEYFKDTERRDPTLSELKVLDTYWSDHCRHTTFLTEIQNLEIDPAQNTATIQEALECYLKTREQIYGERIADKPVCLMDMALLGAKALRKQGKLEDLEVSEEVNACSIIVPVEIDGKTEEWLVMFKNETHNHPTEIEPFGGAATCLGGAIRDPLSGRSYVYQAMRVTGCADPRQPIEETLEGKLPQRKITQEAARGYSSYGNQIGLSTGKVCEIYHPDYVAKRMEIGAVIAAAPRENVFRGTPETGDIIILVGGRTGRDGIGGATGSSKQHTQAALENSTEVQKGDPTVERKLQRLFRIPEVSNMIVRCNDFGAGGVAVAIGELAPGLDIQLDAVPLKYEGLNGTELAISESQERMAVVLRPEMRAAFMRFVETENLEAFHVATVTEQNRLRMFWKGQTTVNLCRKFLDTNGVKQTTKARIIAPDASGNFQTCIELSDLRDAFLANLKDLNRCSQKGLIERFDSTIGASTVLHPFGGKYRATEPEAMCSKIPTLTGDSRTGTLMSFGFNPFISKWSPFHGAVIAIVESVARIVATGGDMASVRLTLQEYFERLRDNPTRWGKPAAALLGAFWTQMELGIPAIGGKDSMSGSFNDRDVPPTLVSFAVAPIDVRRVISPEFKATEHVVSLVRIPYNAEQLPDLVALRTLYPQITAAIARGEILAAHSVRSGGVAETISRMTLGNGIGFRFRETFAKEELFQPNYGSIVLEMAPGALALGEIIGETIPQPMIECGSLKLSLIDLQQAWETPLESVFPTHAAAADTTSALTFPAPTLLQQTPRPKIRSPKPRVFIPVFPGSNCEYDTAKAFQKAGAETDVFVFRNLTSQAVEASIEAMVNRINNSQILMIPGGFSAGDEPDGSGKFIAAVFRNPAIRDATMRLLKDRDGLILGICNGFQALIKLGLVPYGEIRDMNDEDPTLTFNDIGRHISCYVQTKVLSNQSPWLASIPTGSLHTIAVSHGEGKFYASEAVLNDLAAKGQIATQYVDLSGQPTHLTPWNPNGSIAAIEGITSPDGRVFGKMGHSERQGRCIAKNIPGDLYQPIFANGVTYFS
jgi:phosphoribosylformylglycinamidine synthase